MTSIDIYSVIPVTQSKTCNKCNIDKSLTDFSKDKNSKDGYQNKCKACDKEYQQANKESRKEYGRKYHQTNKERNNIRSKENHIENKERDNARAKEYNKINKERDKDRITGSQKKYRETHKAEYAAYSAKRKALKLKATPRWAELDLINNMYIEREIISISIGIEHHIDHIVPLKSDIVCGLHCIANLQILTATENMSKHNYYWPDMW